jgi:hypothetical protein
VVHLVCGKHYISLAGTQKNIVYQVLLQMRIRYLLTPPINENADSLTVMLVNRDMTASRNVTVNISGLSVSNGSYQTLQLSSLPASETFKSHTDNALKSNTVNVSSNSFSISLPTLSTTAILLKGVSTTGINNVPNQTKSISVFPSPARDYLIVDIHSSIAEPTLITIFDIGGRKVKSSVEAFDGHSPIKLSVSTIAEGYYILQVQNRHLTATKNITIAR